MEKIAKHECDHFTQEFVDFSDDFVFCSSCHNFSPHHKEGYLEKRFSNSWSGYTKRWFLLKNKKLYYFKSKETLRPSGVLDLQLIHMNINVNRKNDNLKRKYFKITNMGLKGKETQMTASYVIFENMLRLMCCIESRVCKNEKENESILVLNPKNTDVKLYLRGEDKEINEWYNLLNKSMDNNKIISQPKFIFSENNFWKIDRISVDIFESIADTGDIVLFRSNHATAMLQRMITRGEYDHIGMILRNDKNNLFLLEALSNMVRQQFNHNVPRTLREQC
ncbi:conserved Plasmodium protein, unknown function [Plasmodium ovale curtisi]|uniref:PH domain-containing protein n=1 Tax=Plasmodium ovale curtisi TaxID=864141 RepID=A0A1A8VWQ1_PLAOA|nr:conserved Plasmodium protein, unknown function [Plasmodium ovale curtisi]SBS93621.1 conserved Plasmodium protein, unknown function [Plasmodium ovale curtisi]